MKLWSKTLIASAVCLILAGCDGFIKSCANLVKLKITRSKLKRRRPIKPKQLKVKRINTRRDKKTGGGRGEQSQQPGLQHQGGSG